MCAVGSAAWGLEISPAAVMEALVTESAGRGYGDRGRLAWRDGADPVKGAFLRILGRRSLRTGGKKESYFPEFQMAYQQSTMRW